MPRKATTPVISESEILEHALVEGAKRFGKPKRSDRIIYGRLHGTDDLLAFAQYVDPDFTTPAHIRLIAEKLTDLEQGKIRRLIVNMPPRHGKSQLVSRIFPVWALGRNPKRKLIWTSYSATVAQEFTRWQRDAAEGQLARDIFPDLRVREDVRAAEEWQTTKGGVVYGAGVGGSITGRGGHILGIDDPFKDYEEASSEVFQERAWNWYKMVLRTRLEADSAIILLHTRWNTKDLTARLLEHEGDVKDGGLWHVLRLPAIDVHGKALWPERFPLEELWEIKKLLGNQFEGLYQQEPIDLVGLLFEDPQYCTELPTGLEQIGYWDPAFGYRDDNALAIGANHREGDDPKTDKIFIGGGHLWKGTLDKSYDLVEKWYHQHKLKKLWIEDNAAQKACVFEMKRRGLNVEGDTATINKDIRIQSNLKMHWHRTQFLRSCEPDFMKQILGFYLESKKNHAPDATSGLIKKLVVGKTSLSKRYSAVDKLFKFTGWRS